MFNLNLTSVIYNLT